MRIHSLPVSGRCDPITPRAEGWRAELNAALLSSPALTGEVCGAAMYVTTGQQPGLFGGPLYSLHKAIAAGALARALSARWNRPVMPLFWIAGDDHDHAEASTAAWVGDDGSLHRWSLAPRSSAAPQRPMSQEIIGAEIDAGIDMMSRTMPNADLSWVRKWWRSGVTIHGAFSGAMQELLEPLGIACIDPTSHAFKVAQAPLLLAAIQRHTELDAAVAAQGDAGTGISAGDGATMVFIETSAGRDRLVGDGETFRARRSGDQFTLTQLADLMKSAPERFSANVLLRPVVESALIPTVAYVAGPGEYRYLTRQAAPLYPLLDVRRQVPVPRWGGAIVEAWADRILAKLDIDISQVLDDDGTLARSILLRDMPTSVEPALDAIRKQLDGASTTLHAAGQEIDPVLDRALESRMRRLNAGVDDLQRLLERHLRRRADIAHSQFQRLRTALMPGGAPQERTLSVGAVLARHDGEWTALASAAADAWAASVAEQAAR